MIDPTKQAEYPIILGEKLAGRASAFNGLTNINYNYKSKSATPQQRSAITCSSRSLDVFNLTVTDKAPNAEQTLTYSYQGGEDPSEDGNLVLVFDADRKVFVLEPVTTRLNFNLRSAPGKTEKQVIEQYEQLRVVQEDDQTSGDDRIAGSTSEDEGPADDSNPYDYRHFLPKNRAEDGKPGSDHTTPEPPAGTSRADTPSTSAASKPAPKPVSRSKAQANPLQQKKRAEKPPSKQTAEQDGHPTEHEERRSSPSDEGTRATSQQAGQSPSSNIIIDGDLIIDMGSPPRSRQPFRVDPGHLSSNNTPDDDGDNADEEMEVLRLPSPADNGTALASSATAGAGTVGGETAEDDDALAAEMEAAFEESAREEEEARSQQYRSQPYNNHAASDDESEVSEEE